MKFSPFKVNGKVFQDAVESAEGYVILRCRADNVATGRILAFYGRTINFNITRVIGGYDSSAEAKKACIADYKGKHENPLG